MNLQGMVPVVTPGDSAITAMQLGDLQCWAQVWSGKHLSSQLADITWRLEVACLRSLRDSAMAAYEDLLAYRTTNPTRGGSELPHMLQARAPYVHELTLRVTDGWEPLAGVTLNKLLQACSGMQTLHIHHLGGWASPIDSWKPAANAS